MKKSGKMCYIDKLCPITFICTDHWYCLSGWSRVIGVGRAAASTYGRGNFAGAQESRLPF